jgi:hypothetical protein
MDTARIRLAGDKLVACMMSGSDSGWDEAIDEWMSIWNPSGTAAEHALQRLVLQAEHLGLYEKERLDKMAPTQQEIDLASAFIKQLNDLTVNHHESLTIDDVLSALSMSGAKIVGKDHVAPMVLG